MTHWNQMPNGNLFDRFDPRVRLLSVFLLCVAVCVAENPVLLGAALLLSAQFCLSCQRLERNMLMHGLMLNLMVGVFACFLLFVTPGQPLFGIGRFTVTHEGLRAAVVVLARANTSFLLLIAFLGRMSTSEFAYALHGLHLPDKFTHLFMFMSRYVSVIHGEYRRLTAAMRLRCFQPRMNLHTLRTYGNLVGVLLVRSFDRADRIMDAMKCRGFHGRFFLDNPLCLRCTDLAFMAVALTLAILLVLIG